MAINKQLLLFNQHTKIVKIQQLKTFFFLPCLVLVMSAMDHPFLKAAQLNLFRIIQQFRLAFFYE